jgi:hypothetical protein
MKYLFTPLIVGVLLFTVFEYAAAYNPSINETVIPYQVYVMDNDIETEAEYLGTLAGDPHMYEFTIGIESKLVLELVQLDVATPVPFSLITVKQNNQNAGVVEVGRLRAKDITWEKTYDKGLALSLLQSQKFEADLKPGIYRVEVSTPDNFGSYMLTIGNSRLSAGYFENVGHVYTIQQFFGKSFLRIFISAYVYIPLGFLLMIGILIFTRKRKLKNS